MHVFNGNPLVLHIYGSADVYSVVVQRGAAANDSSALPSPIWPLAVKPSLAYPTVTPLFIHEMGQRARRATAATKVQRGHALLQGLLFSLALSRARLPLGEMLLFTRPQNKVSL